MFRLNLIKVTSCRLMSTGRFLDTFHNNSIKICSLKKYRTEETIKFISDHFVKHDIICKAFGITNNPKVISELEDLTRLTIEDGVSLIAIDTTTDKVVGAALNTLMIKESYDLKLEEISSKWKQPETRDIVDFWSSLEDAIFDHFKVDCVLDLSFCAVLPKYQSAGVGKSLLDATIYFGKQLNKGDDVNDEILKLIPTPEYVIASCASSVAKHMVIAQGFQSIFKKSYQNLKVKDKSMSEMIQNTKCIEVYYLPLKQADITSALKTKVK